MTHSSAEFSDCPSSALRIGVVVERACMEVGHRVASVGFLVLVAGIITRALGKDAWLMFPVAFACADVAVVLGVVAWTVAARRGTRRGEAMAIVLFSLVVLAYSAVMLVKIRSEAGA